MTTIAQYSFELGALSTPSKIVQGAPALPLPPPMCAILKINNSLILYTFNCLYVSKVIIKHRFKFVHICTYQDTLQRDQLATNNSAERSATNKSLCRERDQREISYKQAIYPAEKSAKKNDRVQQHFKSPCKEFTYKYMYP